MSDERVLYLMVCSAGPARRIETMIRLAHDDGWSVYCVATPSAVEHFVDLKHVERLTGHAVRAGHQGPGQPALPKADAVIVAPATYNTINKWAAGIADTYVTTQLAELTGLGVRIVVLPFVNFALAANKVFGRSVAELREAGIRVLFGPGEFEPHPPRTGDDALERYPWKLALEALAADPRTRRSGRTRAETPR